MFIVQRLNSAIVYDRDFSYTYFGFKTLERSYLLKINKEVNRSGLAAFKGVYKVIILIKNYKLNLNKSEIAEIATILRSFS